MLTRSRRNCSMILFSKHIVKRCGTKYLVNTKMRKFTLLHLNDDGTTEFHSKTPREAALKAASRDENLIVLIEEKKMHIFKGEKRPLKEAELNEFTKSRNITNKPVVSKVGTKSFEKSVDAKKKDDLNYIRSILQEL